ncbi:MAG: hypothetical protein U9P90_02485 [Patescibacteria group bacterium]|nr:hypothetical protein [Patescibacteria group bacterium]
MTKGYTQRKRRVRKKGATKRRVDPQWFGRQMGADYRVNPYLTENLDKENLRLTLIPGTEYRFEDDYVIFEHFEIGNSIFFTTRWILRILDGNNKVVWEREEKDARDE